MLREWKSAHEGHLEELLGIRVYAERGDLRRVITPLLEENRQVWEVYGPESPAANIPVSDVSDVWRREVVHVVIPNNQRVLGLLERNHHLLTDDEVSVVSALRLHARALADRHLGGIVNPGAPRFPQAANDLLRD